MQLVGMDGNAFSILGGFSRAARSQGWTQPQVKSVLDEATSKDYDHLLSTIASHVDDSDDEYYCSICDNPACTCGDEE